MTEAICIQNINQYIYEIHENTLTLTPKNIDITEEELIKTNLHSSKILQCMIKKNDEIISTKRKYLSNLNNIWQRMPMQKILQTTSFNMKLTNEDGKDGYNWSNKLKISIQSRDANYTMKEILNMIKVNKYSIHISIKLESGQIINYKYNM
uniref:Uncharacterized protein n=1 Tax=viral metagenome TaxID=1070528 RepID=A0A6C0IDF7_9ZZZZ